MALPDGTGIGECRFGFSDIGAGQCYFLRPAARHQLGDLSALGFDPGARDIERIAVIAVFDRRQLLTGFDLVALMHQHQLDAALNVESQIDLTDIDGAIEDEGAGSADGLLMKYHAATPATARTATTAASRKRLVILVFPERNRKG